MSWFQVTSPKGIGNCPGWPACKGLQDRRYHFFSTPGSGQPAQGGDLYHHRFVHSSEIWDQTSIGQTTVGTGGWQPMPSPAPRPLIRRSICWLDPLYRLGWEPYYSAPRKNQSAPAGLETLLADNGQQRGILKQIVRKKIDDGQAEIAQSERNWPMRSRKSGRRRGNLRMVKGSWCDQNQLASGQNRPS